MTTSHPAHKNGSARDSRSVRHTKADALNDREFELLVNGASSIEDPKFRLQSRFAILVLGRLGLRAGELTHLDESWLSRRHGRIEIPAHDPCRKGSEGGICGYCAQQRDQFMEYDDELTQAEATARMWAPKTDAAARGVPFDFSPRVELAVERFFEEFDTWPCSRQSVNRRVSRAAEQADGLGTDDVYPHALRATAATFHAGRGLSVLPLKSMFGWSQLRTAQKYLASSDANTSRAVRSTHSR